MDFGILKLVFRIVVQPERGNKTMDTGKMVVVADGRGMKEERQFQTLNSMGFVRGDTDAHQWYLLVNEACGVSGIPLEHKVKEYLGSMLWRFMGRVELFDQLAAFDFFQHVLGVARINGPCTRDVADISLKYVAFFPERSSYRHQPRSVEYVANIGTSLYRGLARESEGKDDFFSMAFGQMAKSFGRAVIVLRSVCPRFALKREIHRESLRMKEARLRDVPDAISKFGNMYFESGGLHGSRNN